MCKRRLVEKYGEGSWSKLVPHFQGRIGKQLRERWNHELRPDIMKGAWTEEEEAMLVVQHRIHRNAWADIAKVPAPRHTCSTEDDEDVSQEFEAPREKHWPA